MNEKIGNRIRLARKRLQMTQEQLAEKMNISISAISRLENGNTMLSLENLIKLANALDIGIQDLLCDLFVYKYESESVSNEIEFQISKMSFSEKKHLLKYIQLMNDFPLR